MATSTMTKRPSGPRRFLKIFASDPMLGRTTGNRLTLDVANEALEPGPAGSRITVVDYDGSLRRYYAPVNLDDPDILLNRGIEPCESDPKFHQQMVYAVAMKVIENFEAARGQVFQFKGGKSLWMLPHAFRGANAYYDRRSRAVLFGTFRANEKDPGPNLPGQTVFTCLSHDVIAHEVTHAILDRIRPYLLEPSNNDVQAFHEGFADIVALFQHFAFRDFLSDAIEQNHTDLRRRNLLVELARQVGYASGMGRSLRSALDEPNKRLYSSVWECHERGSILVAAVFDAFFTVYQRRIRDLLRIATGGTGVLPQGDMHPDLVQRIGNEASKTAQSILTMCIRALDYLPPVDVTFGDYLRAMVTADVELIATDRLDQRGALIEAFRRRGIYPENILSLAEESVVWEPAPRRFPRMPVVEEKLVAFLRPSWIVPSDELAHNTPQDLRSVNINAKQAVELLNYATEHAAALQLDPRRRIRVQGFHILFRTGQDGRPKFELAAQFVQTDDEISQQALGGIPFRGGATVIAAADGTVKYVIAKPIRGFRRIGALAKRRLSRQQDFTRDCELRDPQFNWYKNADAYRHQHMAKRMNLALVHGGVYR